jgi:predicted transcriptional regulator
MSISFGNLALASVSSAELSSNVSHEVLVQSAAQIVGAYVMNRAHEDINLTALTAEVYHTLATLAQAQLTAQSDQGVHARPKVAVIDSVKPDYLICLEDGKRVKMLKRYLKTNFNMSPEEYRNRWNLPESYPMVAPNYAKVRSQLAKKIGLGQRNVPLATKRMHEAAASLLASR